MYCIGEETWVCIWKDELGVRASQGPGPGAVSTSVWTLIMARMWANQIESNCRYCIVRYGAEEVFFFSFMTFFRRVLSDDDRGDSRANNKSIETWTSPK